MTGLANRRQILTTLAHALSEQRGHAGHVAAIFVDFDRLKQVNDALGHQVGDRLLTEVASRLSAALRPEDTVGRQGGDEFVIVLPDTDAAAAHAMLAERDGEIGVKALQA